MEVLVFSQEKFIPYKRLLSPESQIVVYQSVFKDFLQRGNPCIRVGLAYLTGRSFSATPRTAGLSCLLCTKPFLLRDTSVPIGSVLVGRVKVIHRLEKWGELFYETIYLPEIYMSVQTDPCAVSGKSIGGGCYGTVFENSRGSYVWAVKSAKIKEEAMSEPFSKNHSSWHEVNIWKDVLQNLVANKVCPNFPLLYSENICRDSVHLHMELASGTLKTWLSNMDNASVRTSLYSAIFQVFAALHAIQLYGQIMHYDMKKENVLFFTLEPGGFWKYNIRGIDYYVPNEGYLFVLADFGLARPLSPEYRLYKSPSDQYYRAGHRFAKVENGKLVPIVSESSIAKDNKTGKWEDGTVLRGAQYVLPRPEHIEKFGEIMPSNIPIDSLKNSEIYPPFEFYNDTQDAIRMFIGGKRTTQEGSHKKTKIHNVVRKALTEYLGPGVNMAECNFSFKPEQVLAGHFIEKFFSTIFRTPEKDIIESYTLKF